MIFKALKDEVWKASTRIKAYLKEFFSNLLKGKLGKNTLYGPEVLAEAHHQMLCTEATLSSTAMSMGLAHTTLTRKSNIMNVALRALSLIASTLLILGRKDPG